jgi:glycosyltransferase involved in cell wall biosynthesis
VRRLRVASLFTELAIGGDENRVLAFAREIDRTRFDHLVITLVTADADTARRGGPMEARYRAAGVPCLSLGLRRRSDEPRRPRPLSALRDSARLWSTARRLAALFRREAIDVVDARMTYNMVVGLAAARLARVPIAIATEYYVDWWARAPWRWIAPTVFDGFDALVSDSRWALDQYRRDLRRPLEHAVVIPNGVPEPRSDRSRDEMRRALAIPERARVIGQVARIVEYKGQLPLIRAAARVMRDAPDVWLLLCGYVHAPEYAATLEREARALGVAGRVRILPWPGAIADVWRAVDLHAHPSLLDSSPIAIHESMALGLPAVVSSAGGIPELVADEVTGLVVPPNDVAALARALARLLSEPQTCARLGEAARRRYLARHRPEQMTRAIEALIVERYERAMRGAPVGARLATVGG